MLLSVDAHRGSTLFKQVCLAAGGMWDCFLVYRNLVSYPTQLVNGFPWLVSVQMCIFPSECVDTQSIRLQVCA